MQKGSALIFVLIGVLLVSGLAGWIYYMGLKINKVNDPVIPVKIPYLSPSPTVSLDETSSWKTYQGANYNLSFRYPQNWSLNDQGTAIHLIGENNEKINFLISKPNNVNSLDEWIGLVDRVWGAPISTKKIKVGGIDAVTRHEKRVGQDGNEYEIEAIHVISGMYVYEIDLEPRNDNTLPLFDKFISTFKFTNITPSPSIGPIVTKPGEMCGGIAGIHCPSGYTCKYEGDYPDAAGTCVK